MATFPAGTADSRNIENSPGGTAESVKSVRRRFESGATQIKLDNPMSGRGKVSQRMFWV